MTQDLCTDRLAELGFEIEHHDYGSGINIIGRLSGNASPETEILVSAHYDHIDGCPGADDNATGVAGVLETARVLSLASFEKTLLVACWDEEEAGLLGSRAYAERAREAGQNIEVAIVLEMIGYTDDTPGSQSVPSGLELLFPDEVSQIADSGYTADFFVAVSDAEASEVVAVMRDYADAAGLTSYWIGIPSNLLSSDLLYDLRRSDHDSFWQAGYSSIMVTDTGENRYPAYHCRDGDDVVTNLDHDFAATIIKATVAATAKSLVVRP